MFIACDYRLELERLPPKRADYRGSVETIHLSTGYTTRRLDLTLEGALVQRVNPDCAELPEGSVSIGGEVDLEPLVLRTLLSVSGDSLTPPTFTGESEAKLSFQAPRGRAVTTDLTVSAGAEPGVAGSLRVSTTRRGTRLSLSVSLRSAEHGVDIESIVLSYSVRGGAAETAPDEWPDAP